MIISYCDNYKATLAKCHWTGSFLTYSYTNMKLETTPQQESSRFPYHYL